MRPSIVPAAFVSAALLAACQPAAPAPGAQPAAAQACPLASTWQVASDTGAETWVILPDGTVNKPSNLMLKGNASQTDNRLVINFSHGDWAGVIGLTVAANCQTAEGTYQYTAVPQGQQLEPAVSVTATRVSTP